MNRLTKSLRIPVPNTLYTLILEYCNSKNIGVGELFRREFYTIARSRDKSLIKTIKEHRNGMDSIMSQRLYEKRIYIRLNDEDYALLQNIASDLNMSVAELIRDILYYTINNQEGNIHGGSNQ